MKESNLRSVIKTATWRVLGSVATMAIAYYFTEEATISASIGAVEFIAKTVLYYLHERGWQWVKWGRS